MGKVWVKLTTPKTIEVHGHGTQYKPGEWVEVGKMLARQWLGDGSAIVPRESIRTSITDFANCGIVVYSGDAEPVQNVVQSRFTGLPVVSGEIRLEFAQTLLYDVTCPLRLDLAVIGFHRLTAGWQIAAPLWNYSQLARDIGTEAERAQTETIIHDLRVPLYDTRLVYVRRSPQTEQFISIWKAERKAGDDKLAFMRALYITKLVMCALPVTWKARRA
jgi:hypothetical protein